MLVIRSFLSLGLSALLITACSKRADDDGAMPPGGSGGASSAAGAGVDMSAGGSSAAMSQAGNASAAGSSAPQAGSAAPSGAGSGAGDDAGAMTGSDAGRVQSDGGASDLPPTGTFPDVDDLAGDGPYTAVTETGSGPGGAYTLFYPQEPAPEGALNPIVAWGNGGFTTPGDYDYLLPHFATHGFVVIAADNNVVSGPEIRAGIEWIVEQNDDSSSPLYQRLDVNNVAGVGYSNGGLAVLDAADDPHLVTLVIISGANMNDQARAEDIPKMHTPTAYLCTDDEASEGNCAGDYAMVTVPAFFGVMNGSAHTDVTELLGLGVAAIMERLASAATAWLRWQQMADQTREPMFIGDDCGLCTDANWTVAPQKNW